MAQGLGSHCPLATLCCFLSNMAVAMKRMKSMKAMRSMKAMGATKAMKSMRRMKKAKRVSVIAKGKRSRMSVFNGTKEKTYTGLTKAMLIKNKNGRIVSKKASANSKKRFATSGAKKWSEAFKAARKALNIKGFVACGGKTAQGKALYAKTKALLK